MKCLAILIFFVCIISIDALFSHPSGQYPIDRSFARSLASTDAEYDVLGSVLTSDPHCLSRDGHVVHCFFVTSEGSVGYANIKNGKAEFKDFGGSVHGQPQTVGYGGSGVLAHFVNSDRKLVVAAVETGTKYDEKATVTDVGKFREAPGCATMSRQDMVFCVGRGTDGGMYSFRFSDGDYERRSYVCDSPNSPLTCDLNPIPRSMHCWSTTEYNIIAERLFSDEGLPLAPHWIYRDIKARGRVLVKVIGVLPWPRALDYYSTEMVDHWGTYGGDLKSEPDCDHADSRSLDCFALDVEGGIQRNYQLLGRLYVRRTSGWVHYGGSFIGKPSCIYLRHDDSFHCYIRSKDTHELVEGKFAVFGTRVT